MEQALDFNWVHGNFDPPGVKDKAIPGGRWVVSGRAPCATSAREYTTCRQGSPRFYSWRSSILVSLLNCAD